MRAPAGHVRRFRAGLLLMLAAFTPVVVGLTAWAMDLPLPVPAILGFALAGILSPWVLVGGGRWGGVQILAVLSSTLSAALLTASWTRGFDWGLVQVGEMLMVTAALCYAHTASLFRKDRRHRWGWTPAWVLGLLGVMFLSVGLDAPPLIRVTVMLSWFVAVPAALVQLVLDRNHMVGLSATGWFLLATRLDLRTEYRAWGLRLIGQVQGHDLVIEVIGAREPPEVNIALTVKGLSPEVVLRKKVEGTGHTGDAVLDMLLESEGPVGALMLDGLHDQLLPALREEGIRIEGGSLHRHLEVEDLFGPVGGWGPDSSVLDPVLSRMLALAKALASRPDSSRRS
jgi:hypothetical protein